MIDLNAENIKEVQSTLLELSKDNSYKDLLKTIKYQNQIIKQNKKVGISKYNNQVKVLLDDILSEYTLKKIIINDKHYVLIENKYQKNDIKNYSYNVLYIPVVI